MSFLDIPQMNNIKYNQSSLFEVRPNGYNLDYQYIQVHGSHICNMVQSALYKGASVEDLYEAILSGFQMFSGLKMLVERQITYKNMINGPLSIPKGFYSYMNTIKSGDKENIHSSTNSKNQDDTAYTLSLLGQLDDKRINSKENSPNRCKTTIIQHPLSLVTPLSTSFLDKSISSSQFTNNSDSNSEDSLSSGVDPIFIQEKGSESNRRKRGRKKISKSNLVCEICKTKETPEWRRGPNGPSTLCNACGIRYSNKKRKEKEAKMKGSIQRILES